MLFFILQMKKQIKEVIFKQIPNFFWGGIGYGRIRISIWVDLS